MNIPGLIYENTDVSCSRARANYGPPVNGDSIIEDPPGASSRVEFMTHGVKIGLKFLVENKSWIWISRKLLSIRAGASPNCRVWARVKLWK